MNGSINAVGRQGAASALAEASAAEQTLAEAAEWPGDKERLCLLCRKRQGKTASCEHDARALEVLEGRRQGPLIVGRPPRVVVCKDCCIAALVTCEVHLAPCAT